MLSPSVSVKLRQATSDDSQFVYTVKKRAMGKYIEQSWGKWDERFQQEYHRKHFDPSATQIIGEAGRDIGFVVVRDYPEYRNVESIQILPGYQNRGIGGTLIKQLLEASRREGRAVRLHVLKINPAVGLYKRLKFRIIGETDKHFVMEWRPEL